MLYTAEGGNQIEQLWDETMVELDFAKPRDILSVMGGKQ